MTKLDTDMVDIDGARVDSHVLQDCDAMWRAVYQSYAPRTARTFDLVNQFRMCGLERVCSPMSLLLPPKVTGLQVRIRHQVFGPKTDLGFTHGALVRAMANNSRPIAASEEVGATRVEVGDGESVTTINLGADDLSQVRAGGPVNLFITGLSELDVDGRTLITDTSDEPDGHLDRWQDFGLTFAAQTKTTIWDTGLPFGAVEVQRLEGGVYTNPLDAPRQSQVIRAWNEAGQWHLYMWPPSTHERDAVSNGTIEEHAFFTPLTYSQISCVEVRITSFEALPGAGTQYNTGAPPASTTPASLYAGARSLFRDRGVWHGTGAQAPLELSSQQDGTDPSTAEVGAGLWWEGARLTGVGNAPVSQDGFLVPLNSTNTYTSDVDAGVWADTCEHSAFARATFDPWPRSSSRTRSRLRALALVAMVSYNSADQNKAFGLRQRLRYTDASGDEFTDTVTTRVTPTIFGMPPGSQYRAGHLLGLHDYHLGDGSKARAHTLRGVYPCSVWHRYQWAVIDIEETLDTANDVSVALQVQVSDTPLDGGLPSASSGKRYLHVATFGLSDAHSADPVLIDPLGGA